MSHLYTTQLSILPLSLQHDSRLDCPGQSRRTNLYSVYERNCVYNKVTVKILCIQMCHNNCLISFSPDLFSKIHSYLVTLIRCYFILLKADDSKICLNNVLFSKAFLIYKKLISCNHRISVDSIYI